MPRCYRVGKPSRLSVLIIHPIPQFLPRLEVRNEFAVEADGLAGFGITADARGAVVQEKLPKPRISILSPVARA